MWIHPTRFNEDSPVRAADLNDLATDHEVLLGDVARANLPLSSPIWTATTGELYKDLALWYQARYLWMRVTGQYVSWWLTINGVERIRRTWPGGGSEYTWTETLDLTALGLTANKIYDCRIDWEAAGDPSWIHLKAIHQQESI
jgi:hypothetical protein